MKRACVSAAMAAALGAMTAKPATAMAAKADIEDSVTINGTAAAPGDRLSYQVMVGLECKPKDGRYMCSGAARDSATVPKDFELTVERVICYASTPETTVVSEAYVAAKRGQSVPGSMDLGTDRVSQHEDGIVWVFAQDGPMFAPAGSKLLFYMYGDGPFEMINYCTAAGYLTRLR